MAIGGDRTVKPTLRCLLLLHSSLTPLSGQCDCSQSCKYTLGASFVIISQNFLIAHQNLLGVQLSHTMILNIFYGMQLLHKWHFIQGQACNKCFI